MALPGKPQNLDKISLMTVSEFLQSPPGILSEVISASLLILGVYELLVRRTVRVLVHRAYFNGNKEPRYFINVTNLSRSREVEIVNLWFEMLPRKFVSNSLRPLPKRLKLDETWETWIDAKDLEGVPVEQVYKLARVKLSNGRVVKSKQNTNVAQQGPVPGDPPLVAATGTLYVPPTASRISSQRAIELLKIQLADPVERLRHDDSKVTRWENLTHRILTEAFGKGSRQANHFVCTVSQSGLSDKERQREHKKWVRDRKALLESCIEELEVFPFS